MSGSNDKEFWDFVVQLTRPALIVVPTTFLAETREQVAAAGIQAAVGRGDSGPIFRLLLGAIQYQGVSDVAAETFIESHGIPSWDDIECALMCHPTCSLLRSYWDFSSCGYGKTANTCSRPEHFANCPLPDLSLRKGDLNQAAYSLWLFLRDICGGDVVCWIDQQLEEADIGSHGRQRATRLRDAVLEPFLNVHGVSKKTASMALSGLLLGADPARERWITAGAAMVAVDTLVHNFFRRSGILRRADAEHRYGPQCYERAGCAAIIDELAKRIEGLMFNPDFPRFFPRFIQHAIWRFCAQTELDVCNGNQIDDRFGCRNTHCPSFLNCERRALHSSRYSERAESHR